MPDNLFPTSFAQQRLWFLDQIEPGNVVYNLPRIFRMTGKVDLGAFSSAINALVVRQDALRTVFLSLDGEPRQSILPAMDVDLPVIDLSHLPEKRREDEALRIATEEAGKPFSLTTGPLLRLKLIRLAAEEHILVLVMHHIVTDGWSMSIFFRELAAQYQALTIGSPPDLPELAIHFRDFANWQNQEDNRALLQPQVNYWNKKLAGATTVLDIPTDHPHPAVQTAKGGSEHFFIDENATEKLKCICQSEGATLFMVLLAAFQAFLWRYTAQETILVGTPVAGRNELELENLIGFFVNTLVLRADLSGEMTFRDLLKQARATSIEGFANQDVPFERLVEELKPERSMAHSPLFQVMLIFQNAPKQKLKLRDLIMEELEFDSGIAKFDLTLEIIEQDGLHCTLEYNSDLFERTTIQRMIGHFENLIGDFIQNPDTKISALNVLTKQEREQILVEWNDTFSDYPEALTIHTAFEQVVARVPESAALVHDGKSLTYRQLNDRSNRLAHYLIQKNVKPGSLVGISIDPSLEMTIAILAVLKAGAAYVPLDPSEPEQRLTLMLEDSNVSTIITRHDMQNKLPENEARIVFLDREKTAIVECSPLNVSLTIPSTDLAYVIYTSGSTGAPKGVEGTHRASMNRFAWMWNAYPFHASETCCQKTALSFIDSVWEIFGPLLQGIRTVIVPRETLLEPQQFIDLLFEWNVSRLVLVPSLLRMLLDQFPNLATALPKLNLWSVSGEVLSSELVHRFQEALPDATLLNIYGSSEIAGDVTWHELRKPALDKDNSYSAPIGMPISNTQIYILDRFLGPVPVGVRGEIHVGGANLARGYWNKPEATAERFITNPFDQNSATRLYKTGDFGRFLPDGVIEYLGRADSQVKIRGMRVELEEVESVLRSHPLVSESAVVVTNEKTTLAAYVVGAEGQAPVAAQLRRFAHSKLPEHMVPSHYIVVESLPVLPSGKINRKQLQSRDLPSSASEDAYKAPRTEIEETLAKIWSEVLKIKRVGVEDNFFELGGHSLLAVQVISRVRRTLDVEISVRSIFEEPIIASLAEKVVKAKADGLKAHPPIITKAAPAGNREMLMAQLDKLSPEEIRALLDHLSGNKPAKSTDEVDGADRAIR
jgi:amino acid adenylation domain-containing protein